MQAAPAIEDMIERLNAAGSSIRYEFAPAVAEPADETTIVLSLADLDDHRAAPHARYLAALGERGFGSRKRLISASVALRLGWATGFEIGSYVLAGALPRVRSASLVLDKGLVRKVVMHDVSLEDARHLPLERRRQRMAARLYRGASGFVRTHHEWSRLSERALFSMLESSWAGQFVTFGERAGRCEEAAGEAAAVLAAHPVLARDAPDLYSVEAAGRRKTCQRRTLCCLYYKMPNAGYCGSCPILSEDERAVRQRKYVSQYGQAAQ